MNRFSEIKRHLLSKFPPILLPNKNRKDLIIAGSGRSGTTWLLNIVSSLPGYRVVFEPFHEKRCKEFFNFLPPRPYLRVNENNEKLKNYITNLLSKRIKNEFINSRNKRFITYQTIIKFIRANLVLDWIYHNFHIPIIFIIRHPCAVVHSFMKLKWDDHLDDFLRQEKLMQDHLAPYENLIWDIKKQNKRHKKYATMWAIENSIVLKSLYFKNWFFITYEELFLNRKIILNKLFQNLGYKYTKKFEKVSYQKSSTAEEAEVIYESRKNALTGWTYELSNEMVKDILDIISKFGIELYCDQPMPKNLSSF